MDEDYISISTLNDFIFCPYSIYLHNVYMESDNSMFHAAPQTTGRIAHRTIDTKKANNTERILNNLKIMIEEEFSKKFSGEDSVIIFEVDKVKLHKYGNAIHRDKDVVYF